MKKSIKKSMKKSMQKTYSKKKNRYFLKGGVYSRIGTIDPRYSTKIMEDNFVTMSKKDQNTFAYFHCTNLENAFTFPNNDEKFFLS